MRSNLGGASSAAAHARVYAMRYSGKIRSPWKTTNSRKRTIFCPNSASKEWWITGGLDPSMTASSRD